MLHLVVHPGTPQAWEIQLKPGLNLIGRNASNDFAINDPSVSSTHCQVYVANGSMHLKDLDSTNGTFLDEARIQEEMIVRDGQLVRLGEVELLANIREAAGTINLAQIAKMEMPAAPITVRWRGSPAAPPDTETTLIATAAATADALEEPGPVFCKNHYQNAALFKCPKCNRYLCDLCVNVRGSTSGGTKSCKICGGPVAPVSVKAHLPRPVDFFKSLSPAFKYPLLGDGLMLLICGAFFFGALDISYYIALRAGQYGMRPMMLRVVVFTFIFGTGYLFSYLKKIVHSTASGDPRMPDWPELTEWQADILAPMFQFVVIAALSFTPGIYLYFFWFDSEMAWQVWLTLLAGCFYFPMGLLGVAMFDTLKALNPLFVIGTIARVPREYSMAALIFAGILTVRWLCESGLERLIPIPLIPTLFADLLGIYLLIVETRILGLLYLSRKNALGWFVSGRRG